MHALIQYAVGLITLGMAIFVDSIPIAIQGLAIVIWASSVNLQESRH